MLVEVTGADGSVRRWCLLLADTPTDRSRGLMDVTSLGRYEGMVFRFPSPVSEEFYMLRTRLPLSIAFIGADGDLVSTADMTPCPNDDDLPPCPRYRAAGEYALAVEVPEGGLGRLGVVNGARVRVLGDAC